MKRKEVISRAKDIFYNILGLKKKRGDGEYVWVGEGENPMKE